MKWGVRRSQEELDRLGGRAYTFEKVGNDYVLKKGSKVHRVTATPNKEKKGYAYVSFDDLDVKGYRKEITRWLEEDGVGKTFDMTMKATHDLLLPGELTKVKTFINLFEDKKISDIDLIRIKKSYGNGSELVGKPKRLCDVMVSQGMDHNLAERYALFNVALYEYPTIRELFFNSLKEKGYSAVEDFEDMYSHRVRPVIVFDREKSLKVTNVLPLPSSLEEGWDKIINDARASDKLTKEILKARGVTYA